MVELAIVLGIMGVIMAALWGTTSVVQENIKRKLMEQQIVLIVNNTRNFFMSRVAASVDLAGVVIGPAPLTDYLLKNNVLLPENIGDRSGAQWTAVQPWGGALTIQGINLGTGARQFQISLFALRRSSCIALTASLSAPGMPEGLVSVTVNGTVNNPPVSPDLATVQCNTANANIIQLTYNLRKEVI